MGLATKILKEITPLTQSDCFSLFSRSKKEFDFPLHFHEEFELNFIQNAAGAKRVVGDHVEEIGNTELVLIGPNLQHGWFTHKCKDKIINEITIQFHRDLFDEKFLNRNQMSFIRTLLPAFFKRRFIFTGNTLFDHAKIDSIATKAWI